MNLIYSSHGDSSLIYSLCTKSLPDTNIVKEAHCALLAAIEDPERCEADLLDRRDIRDLASRCDPQYFLFLRELSVFLRNSYSEACAPLRDAGYIPVKRALIRFPENTSPIEMLAAGICSAVCGVKETVFSLDRAAITPAAASAFRLCGVETVLSGDEISAVCCAVSSSPSFPQCDVLIGKGSEKLRAAASLVGELLESYVYPIKNSQIFVAFSQTNTAAFIQDIGCTESDILPVVITASEELATEILNKHASLNGYILVTSSDEESAAVTEKCASADARLYGSAPQNICGYPADLISPLMTKTTAPAVAYPYSPAHLMRKIPDPSAKVSAITFASAIARFVGKDVLPECEVGAIGERMLP